MSRHKKKYKHKYDNRNENNLDMSNIQSMLNGIDMNQLSNIMASLNKANNNNNNYNNNNYNNNDYDNDDDETYNNNFSSNNMNTNQIKNDYTLQFLNMLRPMINPEKKDILDKLIQIYYVSKLIKK